MNGCAYIQIEGSPGGLKSISSVTSVLFHQNMLSLRAGTPHTPMVTKMTLPTRVPLFIILLSLMCTPHANGQESRPAASKDKTSGKLFEFKFGNPTDVLGRITILSSEDSTLEDRPGDRRLFVLGEKAAYCLVPAKGRVTYGVVRRAQA